MDSPQIALIRRFNRLVTRRVGALDDSYLRRGRPLGEARLLFEVGSQGDGVRRLRDRLGLDSGYLSRLLRSLEAQGLILVRRAAGDGRRRHVELTAKGQAEVAAYDALSDALARSLLAPLSDGQCRRLLAAMAEVERLIRAGEVEVRPEAPDSEAARGCLEAYFRELAERFDAGFDPARSNPASDAEMTPPQGFFVVAWLEGSPVGCGALKRSAAGGGEIKRMWTDPAARGMGVARKVLRRLEARAREIGLSRLRLETNRTLREAQALYRGEGYREVAPFNDEPYADYWFEKELA
jgi:DNA-binding MarR family transcriptional regulator/GNAT superfamily N-acetyltransferase